MFGLWNMLYGYWTKKETRIDSEIKELEKNLEKLEEEEKSIVELKVLDNKETTPDIPQDYELCQHRIGIITHLFTDHGFIDGKLNFHLANFPSKDLHVGLHVNYIAFRSDASQEWRVNKILSVQDDTWDEKPGKDTDNVLKRSGALKRNLIGQVLQREGREVVVSPDIRCCLDKITAEFIPQKGDWVVLEALNELDGSVLDFAGRVLDITRLKPLRSKVFVSVYITHWDEKKCEGVIDKCVWFTKSECEMGYRPQVLDEVSVEAIESSQSSFSWRALAVVALGTPRNADRIFNDTEKENPQVTKTHPKRDSKLTVNSKNGIEITNNLSFGTVNIGQCKELNVEVSNISTVERVLLRGRFHGRKSESQLSVISGVPDNTIIIPGQKIICKFCCKGKFVGVSSEFFVFTFNGFRIGRYFDVEVIDPSLSDLIPVSKSAVPKNHFNRFALAQKLRMSERQPLRVRGVRPNKAPNFIPVKHGLFMIPPHIWRAVLGEEDSVQSEGNVIERVERAVPMLAADLSPDNYCRRFHALLYLEEIEQTLSMRFYDMDNAIFTFAGPMAEYLALEVPGLAEKRPSLMIGDRIIAKRHSSRGKEYEGFIHKLCTTEVWVKFDPDFHIDYDSSACEVSFMIGRTPLKRCHAAIDLAYEHLGPSVLFPAQLNMKTPQVRLTDENSDHDNKDNDSKSEDYIQRHQLLKEKRRCRKEHGSNKDVNAANPTIPVPVPPKLPTGIVKLKWINPGLNQEQKAAVRNVLRGEARPLPYVIFGPPGTGKTVTLVETILQIFTLIPDSRILVATPSNSSADLLAERLLMSRRLSPGDLVRLVGHHVLEEGNVPEALLPYVTTGNISSPKAHDMVPLTETLKPSSNAAVLGRHRITVGTCIALGLLYNMGFPAGHFTHVVVDEAGQATEPELLVPLGFLHTSWGQAVLAGDPLQLGPVVGSRMASHFGLGHSLLARLLEQFPYQRDPAGFPLSGGYNLHLVMRLVRNYRSLPGILALPSSLFYDSQLLPQVSEETSCEVAVLKSVASMLPKSDRALPPAMVFHGVRGKNLQDSDSPSWFNPQEIVQVIYYLTDLYAAGIKTDDIGIITPYQKQVQKLRSLLTQVNMPAPKIGSVEEFQGQERMVIIMSVVRSSPKMVHNDIRHALGFVASPQRLNVAITRARSLLVIIGNPHLLAVDPHWKKVLLYCIDNEAYTGCDLPKEFNDIFRECSPVA